MPTNPATVGRWWETTDDGRVHCYLCPRHCQIPEGKTGFCFIRMNEGGQLVTLGYGHPAAIQIDPIEKKPLNHFLPGTQIFSLGTAGCNMGCKFCQNWDISKAKADQVRALGLSPEEVCLSAIRYHCPSLAFTYNEPTIWAEYAIDIARAARRMGLKTVAKTNGYITPEARGEFYAHMDAANIDLKAFTERFYSKVTLTHLEPVLDTIKYVKRETPVWLELTTLLIPDENDALREIRELVGWVLENLGDAVPLHFTAFHPDFRMLDKPRTPAETLLKARGLAIEMGAKYVYAGNIHDSDSGTTYCPGCGKGVIVRDWHQILAVWLNEDRCAFCDTRIPLVLPEGGLIYLSTTHRSPIPL